MTVKAEVLVGHGASAYCEVSGGHSETVKAGTHAYTFGQQGSSVSFLKVKRESAGSIVVKILSGNAKVEIDGNYKKPRPLKAGKSFAFSSKNKSADVREAVK